MEILFPRQLKILNDYGYYIEDSMGPVYSNKAGFEEDQKIAIETDDVKEIKEQICCFVGRILMERI